MRYAPRPEAVAGQPQAVRWIVPHELPLGQVQNAPGTVGPLLTYGVVTQAIIEPGAVCMWLAEGHTWLDLGPRIRGALGDALALDGWQIAEASGEPGE